MRNRNIYIVSKYLPLRNLIITKGKTVTSQWSNLQTPPEPSDGSSLPRNEAPQSQAPPDRMHAEEPASLLWDSCPQNA